MLYLDTSLIVAALSKAAKIADQHALGLRAGDALHLAIASEHGATVHTLDQRLAEAGPAIGVAVRLLACLGPSSDRRGCSGVAMADN